MFPITRILADTHIGHACNGTPKGHPKPFHKTPYVSTPQTKVTVGGKLAVCVGGATGCGDVAVGGSSRVTAGGIPVHRALDATSGHPCHFVPNASAASFVFVKAG